METIELSLGQLARDIPGATAVFHKHKLNFCCDGDVSLRQAADARQVDAATIAAELNLLTSQTQNEEDVNEKSDSELIEYILARYHDHHRQQFLELIRLAQRVERVHETHPDCPTGLSALLQNMQVDLEAHMAKEEQILFPMIAQGRGAEMLMPISIMRQEHDNHGVFLKDMEGVSRNYTLPEGACNTWAALYQGLAALRQDLVDHIHLENNVLFPRFDG